MTSLEARTIDGAGPDPRILRPGVRSLPVGMERYRVAGGGSVVFRVYEGDCLQVVNVEGRQPAEILAFTDGRCEAGMLDVEATGQGNGLIQILNSEDPLTKVFKAKLDKFELSLDNLQSLDFFGVDGQAGEQINFIPSADGTVIVVAPGDAMKPNEQTPPTALDVFIERADPVKSENFPKLPDPLADPRVDLRIVKRTAA